MRTVSPPMPLVSWPRRRRAFTLIELLVVMSIIVVMLGAIVVAGSGLVNRARIRSTESVLSVVRSALEEFRHEQSETPTITRARQGEARYRLRYGLYPPDELEVFTDSGLPGGGAAGGRSLAGRAVGGAAAANPDAAVIPGPLGAGGYPNMDFYTIGGQPQFEHRDLAAMVLAIELHCEPAAAILDRLPEANRTAGPLLADGEPQQFLDRDRNDQWDPGVDQDIRYVVDGWGVPLTYLAQRDYIPAGAAEASSNDPAWNQASTEMIRLNGDEPILMSYGPDGRDQLAREAIDADDTAVLVRDWVGAGTNQGGVLDNPLNLDNVFANPELKEKLTKPRT